MSIQAYQRAATQSEAPRDLEYRVFGQVTAGLVKAREAGRTELGALARALQENQRFWTVLAADCAQPDNALAPPVRARIISLAIFVERHSRAVLREGADVDVLIDLNRSMMEGLAARQNVNAG